MTIIYEKDRSRRPRYEKGFDGKVCEFKREEFSLYEKAIDKVSKTIANVFNEIGKNNYSIHKPIETGETGHEIYDSYSTWGTAVVEPHTTYMGYYWSASQRYLAVYIEDWVLGSVVGGIEKVLEVIKENFGEFNLRTTKEECNESNFRVFNKKVIDINFSREIRENFFEDVNEHIADFCIVIGADPEKDKKKYMKRCKKALCPVIY